eukprot:m.48005 g.48005  ORF g.48005 m.48005 type:complete len:619 (+) comp6949_c0_seq1:114-1970(+)
MVEGTDITMVVVGTSIAAMVGAVVMNLFKRSDELDLEDAAPTASSTGGSKSKSSKKNKKAKKSKSGSSTPAVKQPEPEPEESSEEEEAPPPEPAPTASKSSKKKKKNKGGAAAAAPAPEPEPEPTPAPTASKKKKKKADKAAAAAAAAPAPAPKAAPEAAAASKKKNKNKNNDADEGGWEVVPTSAPRRAPQPVIASDDDGKSRVVIDVTGHKPAIIGAKGAVIQELTSKSGAKIDLGKENNDCVISGSTESVQAASAMVRAIIKERMDYRASQVEETVNVPVDRIPAIIGKGGSKIKEIQSASGASVNIDKDSNVVTLKGTAFEVQTARELIEAVVNPPEPQYEATTQMDLSLHPMGQRAMHVIKGYKGQTIRQIETETQAKLDIEKGSSIMSIKGTQAAVVQALQMVSRVLIENGNQEVMPIKDSRTVGAILGRQGANIRKVEADSKASLHLEDNDDGSKKLIIEGTAEQIAKAREMVTDILEGGPVKPTPGPGEVVEEIECPASAVGSIIGKGGSEIKNIQEATGARVDVPRGSPVCWVVGTKKAVDAASKLIKSKIAATLQQEQERADRARQMAENAAKTTELFSATAQPAEEDEGWGQSVTGADDSWGTPSGW